MERNSNFELLRIICIFGIITMHSFGTFFHTATGISLFYGTLINSVFNMGVSCFMLISGYFGIRFSVKKFVALETTFIFYAVAGVIIQSVCGAELSGMGLIKELIKACLPVLTVNRWYMTVYMVLFVFSGFINLIPEKLKKADFQKLLFLMLLIYSAIPTIIGFHIMGDDGKGIMNMLLIYLIGRYIAIYGKDTAEDSGKLLIVGGMVIVLGFLLNYGKTMAAGGVGIVAPYGRDCSLINVMGSIFVFLLFRNMKIKSSLINKIAACVFAMYLSDWTIRAVLDTFFDLGAYLGKWYFFAIMAVYVIVVMGIGLTVELIRKGIMVHLDRLIVKSVNWFSDCVVALIKKIITKFFGLADIEL